jgi:hypothetical protein
MLDAPDAVLVVWGSGWQREPLRSSGSVRWSAGGLAANLGDFRNLQKELFFTFMKLKGINDRPVKTHKLIPEKYWQPVF